jgi:hypothetical protein
VTLREAADILGVSKEAVRKRVVRGTLLSDMGEDGRRYVYLDVGGDEPPTHERDALISEMRTHTATLLAQLSEERQAHAEARRIIAGLVERIPAIEPPVSAEDASEGVEPRPATEGSQEATREHRPRASWWRRVFGRGS